MKTFIYCLLVTVSLIAKEPQIKKLNEYLKIMETYSITVGKNGNSKNGEIELLKDPEKISIALKRTGRDIGILHQDRYWIWVNDPVEFPNGKIGVFGRIITKSSLNGYAGCAILPCLKDGRIILNCIFRHATRSWELEIPRGICEKGETPEDSAKRELLEETGFTTKNLTFLGAIPPDTGISSAVIAIFMATVDNCQKTNLEESEAIESILTFTIEELKEGLKNGSILIKTQEKEKQVLLRDPFLAYALLQMEIRGFLRQNTRESPRILIVG